VSAAVESARAARGSLAFAGTAQHGQDAQMHDMDTVIGHGGNDGDGYGDELPDFEDFDQEPPYLF
jgi:hypothetical protein